MDHVAKIVCQLGGRLSEYSEIVGTFLLERHISFLSLWDKLVKLLLVLVGGSCELEWSLWRISLLSRRTLGSYVPEENLQELFVHLIHLVSEVVFIRWFLQEIH